VPRKGERGFSVMVLLAVLSGAGLGIGLYTFGYARGASYMTNDPSACANCHVMREHFEGWMKSSHARVAVCNDCHTPPGLVPRYATKAVNGFFHSLAFTTGRFPDEIRITDRNFRVTESACVKCHEGMVHGIRGTRAPGRGDVSCISCHARVGHM
jgi:cytochrome c nitrite reductase small subunit